MNDPNPMDDQRSAKNSSSNLEEADPVVKSLKKKLGDQSDELPLIKHRIKSIIAVKESGLPLFHIELEKQETDHDKTNVLAGLTSVLHLYASEAVHQEIQELSLEDDKVVFLKTKEPKPGMILGVVAEKTVPSSILKAITTEIYELLAASGALHFKHVEVSETSKLSRTAREIVQRHAIAPQKKSKKFLLKIVLLGDGGVGKTSLFNRFMGKGFKANYLMTIGADFGVKKVNLPNQKDVKFLITDVAGQPHFKEVRKAFYQGTMGGLIVVDVTRPETFKNSIRWLEEAWTHGGPYPVIFLGNKDDLREFLPNSVSHGRIRTLANALSKEAQRTKGFKIPYIPTSAKTGKNVNLAFETLGREITEWILERRLRRAYSTQPS